MSDVRGCCWCPAYATGQTSAGFWACPTHLETSRRLDDAVAHSGRRAAAAQAEVVDQQADDAARVTAYEDALRGIAAATVAARRTPHRLDALQTMLVDVEHHLSSLIALGYVPPQGRPVTSSAPLDPRDPRALT